MRVEYLGRFEERPRKAMFGFWSPDIGGVYASIIKELLKAKHPDVSIRELAQMAREVMQVIYSERDDAGPRYRYFRLVK